MGQPVYLPGYPDNQLKMLYAINRFNLAASDKISVDRKLPDSRKLACRKILYNLYKLPNTSVIIVFHNEAWSTLARTVHSILNTSPQHLLAEILLVDDASNRTFLGPSLDHYMNNLASVRGVNIRIIRSKERVGLIQARLLGVDEAQGQVLTFIDAHCEATQGWLEPLMEQIKLNRRTAACPIIDIINDDTFAYTRSFELHWGAFNWGMNFRWYPISKRELVNSNGHHDDHHNNKTTTTIKMTELVRPFHTPIMAGGLFSIDKSYFEELGRYDPHMDIWGGENIELSLRIWQCGGQLEIVPCSHVAHIFRKSSPYTFRPGKEVADILYTNLARAAEVWIDDWKHFFYTVSPVFSTFTKKSKQPQTVVNNQLVNNNTLHRDIMIGIEDRKMIRDRLKCENFQWFLDNIWPEHFFPTERRFFGNIQLVDHHHQQNDLTRSHNSLCIQRPTIKIGMGQAAVGAIEMQECQPHLGLSNSPQLFVWDNSTGFVMTDESICLDSGSDPVPGRSVILAPCTESKRQRWHFDELSQQLIHKLSGLCLHYSTTSRQENNKIQLEHCKPNNRGKRWRLVAVDWRDPAGLTAS